MTRAKLPALLYLRSTTQARSPASRRLVRKPPFPRYMIPSTGTEYSVKFCTGMASSTPPAAWTEEVIRVCMYWNRMGINDRNMTW